MPDHPSGTRHTLRRSDFRIPIISLLFDQDQNQPCNFPHDVPRVKQGSYAMPIDVIVVLLMAAAFGIFAGTLYWADLHTRAPIK
jgi:hypothetical protein